MRRIDAIGITFAVLIIGGLIYLFFNFIGIDSIKAGIWSQVLLVGGLVVWVLSYLFRVVNQKMTYNQQIKDYEDAVIQKRWEEMTESQREKLQAQIQQEKENTNA